MKHSAPFAALAAILIALAPPGARATIISGQLSITGSAIVDEDTIDWTPPATGTGIFAVDQFVQSGYFTSLAGTSGDILDLDLASAPVNTPNLGIANFMTFAADPSLAFTLQLIAPGPYSAAQCFDPPAAGQVCTFPGSPFGLSNATASSSGVSLVLYGTVSDGSSSPPSAFRGTLTTQFDVPFQQLINDVFVEHKSVRNTYSGTFVVTAVPESATVFLLGAGLLGLAVMVRKRT